MSDKKVNLVDGQAKENVTGAEGQPDPEVSDKPTRRRFSTEYKLRILRELDQCTKLGEKGALMRREGLYSSRISCWRKERERGEVGGLKPKKRGRKAKPVNPLMPRVTELERENRRLRQKLEQAETVIDIQKKASSLLGIPLKNLDDEGHD